MSSLANFIDSVLSPRLPPENPIVREGWAGLAFDRNCHEKLAPDAVWEALLQAHAGDSENSRRIGVISFEELGAEKPASFFPADLAELCRYWDSDARFLEDHYVFSPSKNWLVRLDQDVTLFAGEQPFLCRVVCKLGGLENVMAQMMNDFDPGPTDRAGLRRYLESITQPLLGKHGLENN